MKTAENKKKHCVVDSKSGKRECFATIAAARKRMAALNKPKKKLGDCGCGG